MVPEWLRMAGNSAPLAVRKVIGVIGFVVGQALVPGIVVYLPMLTELGGCAGAGAGAMEKHPSSPVVARPSA